MRVEKGLFLWSRYRIRSIAIYCPFGYTTTGIRASSVVNYSIRHFTDTNLF